MYVNVFILSLVCVNTVDIVSFFLNILLVVDHV